MTDAVKDLGLLKFKWTYNRENDAPRETPMEMGVLALSHTFETTMRTVDFYSIFAMMWKITWFHTMFVTIQIAWHVRVRPWLRSHYHHHVGSCWVAVLEHVTGSFCLFHWLWNRLSDVIHGSRTGVSFFHSCDHRQGVRVHGLIWIKEQEKGLQKLLRSRSLSFLIIIIPCCVTGKHLTYSPTTVGKSNSIYTARCQPLSGLVGLLVWILVCKMWPRESLLHVWPHTPRSYCWLLL